ncbi:MAG: hypothetical protein K8H87_14295, partial [Pseudorhodoplanes sp.]|nr:hypothetical protein [Pseudorhodoplanes sp.]
AGTGAQAAAGAAGQAAAFLEHDPEKCEAVFGKDHARTKSGSMIPKSVKRFSEKIVRKQRA